MIEAPIVNGSGWAFMVAGLMLLSAAWVLPYAIKRANGLRGVFKLDFYHMLLADTELRMMVGFLCDALGVVLFAGTTYARALLTAARDFDDLTWFHVWSAWTLMAPSALLICVGNAMILWDGYSSRRGKWACLTLTLLAIALWFIGAYGGREIIRLGDLA